MRGLQNRRSRIARTLVVITTTAAACVVLAANGASAGRPDPPGHRDANHCVTEFGVDLNELYGMSEQFRTFECRAISAGEHWIPMLVWITDDDSGNVYPDGYLPSRTTPIEDFLAKLVAVKVVVDGGTPQEKTHVFSSGQAVRTDINAEQLHPGVFGAPLPMASILPRMRPVSVGQHVFEPIIELSAQHCDGLGASEELQCLPAGEVSFGVRPLTITAPSA